MDFEQLQSYLDSIGATEFDPRSAESDGESLIMAAGKACYRSLATRIESECDENTQRHERVYWQHHQHRTRKRP